MKQPNPNSKTSTKPKANTVTPAHAEFFRRKVGEYLRDLGLTDRGIHVEHVALESNKAQLSHFDCKRMVGTISLGLEWEEGATVDESSLASTALHEVLHVLLARLSLMAEQAYAFDLVSAEEEAIVRRLEHYIRELLAHADQPEYVSVVYQIPETLEPVLDTKQVLDTKPTRAPRKPRPGKAARKPG